jgi:protein SCO1/2
MEDRLTTLPTRAALALLALLGILLVSASFWALALWPLASTAPEWVARTREICFGSARDGLPHAGGWVLLVGEPAGMLLFLVAAWGYEVREGLAFLWHRWAGRVVLGAVILLVGVGAGAVSVRVAQATGAPFDPAAGRDPELALVPLRGAASELGLVDQHGNAVTVASLRGRPAVVTFVYAHCETVCPIMVHDVLAAAAGRALAVLVTLDPWRDTPSRLASIAEAWKLPGDALLLSGDVETVEFVLNRWWVPRVRNEATGDLIHPTVAYVLDAEGRMRYQTDATEGAVRLALGRVEGGQGGQ